MNREYQKFECSMKVSVDHVQFSDKNELKSEERRRAPEVKSLFAGVKKSESEYSGFRVDKNREES